VNLYSHKLQQAALREEALAAVHDAATSVSDELTSAATSSQHTSTAAVIQRAWEGLIASVQDLVTFTASSSSTDNSSSAISDSSSDDTNSTTAELMALLTSAVTSLSSARTPALAATLDTTAATAAAATRQYDSLTARTYAVVAVAGSIGAPCSGTRLKDSSSYRTAAQSAARCDILRELCCSAEAAVADTVAAVAAGTGRDVVDDVAHTVQRLAQQVRWELAVIM
jgi:prophage DNA circulation protein